MALDTYANLKEEVQKWLGNRADLSATAGGIDTFIDLAEAWFNRNLRVRSMVTTNAGLTVSATGAITHPSDWLAWKQVSVAIGNTIKRLPVVNEDGALDLGDSTDTDAPAKVIVRGTASQVWPYPDGTYTYTGIYYASIPALSGSQTTNWLLTAYPDAYLYGCLTRAKAIIEDQSLWQSWENEFLAVVDEIRQASSADEYGVGISIPIVRTAV